MKLTGTILRCSSRRVNASGLKETHVTNLLVLDSDNTAGANYAVEIWDEKGSGKDPVQDTDDRFEVVKKGDAWLIREFPRTIPERGAKS